jgi:NAD(P)-dependent dehydrogenase (short-subunit alcohol dehydrogenase family)
MEISGRVALVTGGARRLGRAFSLGLARAGAHVVINYHASADAASATLAEITSAGGSAIAVQGDVSRAADVQHLVGEAERVFGGLDILVNSASLFERAPFAEISEADFDRVLAVNLRAPFFLSQAAAPVLAAGSGGTIINILDLSAVQAWPSYAHHAVSKAGLAHLTRVLARVLAPRVRVNAIAPGSVLPPTDDDGQDLANGLGRQVLERAGQPDDAVSALLWLAGADFVTGQVIAVDGGRLLL